MTIRKFAKAIGTGATFVKMKIDDGSIPYTIKYRGKVWYYDIEPELVPIWKEKTKGRKKSPVSKVKNIDKREYLSKNTPLRQATAILEQLKKQGIYMSYGEAEAKGYFAGVSI